MSSRQRPAGGGSALSDYDQKAEEYAEDFADILERTPLDRKLLDVFAHGVTGPVLDVACGPGHIAGYLQQKGLDLRGVDLSERMVEVAREHFPEVDFEVGNLLHLEECAEFAAITAFYAIVHLSDRQIERALAEIYQALRPGGRLLLTFHCELLEGRPEYRILPVEQIKAALEAVGFTLEVEVVRRPLADEDRTRRALIWAWR